MKKRRYTKMKRHYTNKDREKVMKCFFDNRNNSDREISEALKYSISFVNTTTSAYWKNIQKGMKESRNEKMIKSENNFKNR